MIRAGLIDEGIASFIAQIGALIRSTLAQFFNIDWIPEIVFWYWWLFVLFVICSAIIWMFGWSKIVRIVASMAFLFGAIFTAGGWFMARRLKARADAQAARNKPPPKPKPPSPRPW